MEPALSREAAKALNNLPLRAGEQAQFVDAVAVANTREDLPPWAISYLDMAAGRRVRDYATGQRIRFTATEAVEV